jgi:L-ascorbate metabolism protein UlaG (beta-lactamase superfamily)
MHLHLIRNATMRLTYAGRLIVTDPYLGAKGAYRSLGGREPNPTVELPCTPEEAVAGAELALISHLHNDHFDPVGQQTLTKDIPLFCQPEDAERIAAMGFQRVTPLEDRAEWEGITIIRTPGTHGTGTWADKLNPVSGFVLQAPGEPTVYWCGDTIWYEGVHEAIAEHRPDVIVTHSAGAELEDSGPIVMDIVQTFAVCHAAPDARVVAIHLEALDHCPVRRADLRAAAEAHGIPATRLLIPDDGEVLAL